MPPKTLSSIEKAYIMGAADEQAKTRKDPAAFDELFQSTNPDELWAAYLRGCWRMKRREIARKYCKNRLLE